MPGGQHVTDQDPTRVTAVLVHEEGCALALKSEWSGRAVREPNPALPLPFLVQKSKKHRLASFAFQAAHVVRTEVEICHGAPISRARQGR